MNTKKPTVTLVRQGDSYQVTQIRGDKPVIELWPGRGEKTIEVRVGNILTERQVTDLGYKAELLIRAKQ